MRFAVKDLSDWKNFFCLIPRKMTDSDTGRDAWVWLEWVERKYMGAAPSGHMAYYYRTKCKNNK